jgi:hypothetical protein
LFIKKDLLTNSTLGDHFNLPSEWFDKNFCQKYDHKSLLDPHFCQKYDYKSWLDTHFWQKYDHKSWFDKHFLSKNMIIKSWFIHSFVENMITNHDLYILLSKIWS